MPPWLIVFDLDGTLIDSSADLCQSVNAAMRHVGASVLAPETITSYVGDGASMLIERALGEHIQPRLHAEALRYFLDFYRVHKLDTTRPYSGVLEALQRIQALAPSLQMAVLTNKPVRPSREICAGLGLSAYFFAVLGGDSLSRKKPDPEGLLRLIAEARARRRASDAQVLDQPLERVVLVGDSDVDVLTARGAGVLSLGCLYGLAPERLLASRPDAICYSATEWPTKLGLLGRPEGGIDQPALETGSQAAPRTPLESP